MLEAFAIAAVPVLGLALLFTEESGKGFGFQNPHTGSKPDATVS